MNEQANITMLQIKHLAINGTCPRCYHRLPRRGRVGPLQTLVLHCPNCNWKPSFLKAKNKRELKNEKTSHRIR